MKIRLIFFLSILLSSCASSKYVQETYYKEVSLKPMLDSWLGRSESDLIENFGIPGNRYQLSNGGKVLKFEGKKQLHSNSMVIGGMIINNGIIHQHYINFYLNRNDQVYSYDANLPIQYEPAIRIVKKDNSEAWLYGTLGLMSIATIVAVALMGGI